MERVFKVVDLDGQWVMNPHGYTFTDPTTGHRFEPNLPCKIKVTDWMKGQIEAKVLVETDDQEKAASAQKAQEAADAEAAAKAEAEAKAAAEKAAKTGGKR